MSHYFKSANLIHVKARNRFLLAQRACVELYPPVLHQAALLSAIGDVTIVDTVSETDCLAPQTIETIKRLRIQIDNPALKTFPNFNRLHNLRRYNRTVRQEMAAGQSAVIGFEPEAATMVLRSKMNGRRPKRIIHLHEVPAKEGYAASVSSRLALKYLLRNLHRADAVVVPDHGRAEYIQSIVNLKVAPLVVMNCPRRWMELPRSALIPFLHKRGIHSSKIVHYQGSVGPDHCLEAVIKSMRFWPADAVFVIVGGGSERYLNTVDALAATAGVKGRIIFVGRIPYDQLFSYTIGASVGVTLLDPSVLNWELSAGASNKRFEYAALGIPQVTNDGPGIQNLFGNTGIAEVANHRDIEDIGRKISQYLVNEGLAREVGAKARAMHLQTYNYEHQFQKVLEFIC